jgi:hypothetical protein
LRGGKSRPVGGTVAVVSVTGVGGTVVVVVVVVVGGTVVVVVVVGTVVVVVVGGTVVVVVVVVVVGTVAVVSVTGVVGTVAVVSVTGAVVSAGAALETFGTGVTPESVLFHLFSPGSSAGTRPCLVEGAASLSTPFFTGALFLGFLGASFPFLPFFSTAFTFFSPGLGDERGVRSLAQKHFMSS